MNKVQNEYADELIDSSRISVVIQGLTHYVEGDDNCLFYQCVNSIKKYLPDAEIIVSTWEGQVCDTSVVDLVIYNVEPESIFDMYGGTPWNFNKMLISTKNGILKSSREYILKFRSDLSLRSNKIFYVSRKVNVPNTLNKYLFFFEPINISNLSVKNPCSYEHLLFHLSDIVQFGRKEFMLDLWGGQGLEFEEVLIDFNFCSLFFYNSIECKRMVPEQALMIGWLNRRGFNINIKYPAYTSFKYLKISELVLSLNFNIINWGDVGICYPARFIENRRYLKKYLYNSDYINPYFYNFSEFGFFLRCINVYINIYFIKFFSDHFLADFRKSLAVYIIKKSIK
ncbi:hypothetical protein HXZ77_00940 [Acinetobacter johnsonii]|uniref:WavE lipopolysaccharide synthesis family protein n=1 Tax=Acinetobacter johnsonii TaxID=40214 RepID=UPI0025781A30|nr:WavE lipopolysaccharide synthesis family protein [Acinetobacter johnsonii]MDM1249722.1 hypothetical protein [Acinetobacter johnsonii]